MRGPWLPHMLPRAPSGHSRTASRRGPPGKDTPVSILVQSLQAHHPGTRDLGSLQEAEGMNLGMGCWTPGLYWPPGKSHLL